MVHFFSEHLPIIPAFHALKGNGGLMNPDLLNSSKERRMELVFL